MNSAGTVTAVNTFGANGLVSRHSGSTSVFYTFDERGNVAQRFDSSFNVLSTDVYDAYGVGQRSPSGSEYSEPWGYGAQWGYYTDPEDGLVFLTNRYYDPPVGRFLTRDPFSYAGSMNLYGFCGNNPINYADPLGLISRRALAGLGGAALGSFFGPLGAVEGYLAVTTLYDALDHLGSAAGCHEAGYASSWDVGLASVDVAVSAAAVIPGEGPVAETGERALLGVLKGKSAQVSEKGLAIVEQHLAALDPADYNVAMVDRLRAAALEARSVAGADLSFYMHELSEATFRSKGLIQDAAHDAALAKYGVSPFSLYHPDVIRAGGPAVWNENWYRAWGIPR